MAQLLLSRRLYGTTKAVSLLDFDGTMLKGDSIVEYISLAIKEGLCPEIYLKYCYPLCLP